MATTTNNVVPYHMVRHTVGLKHAYSDAQLQSWTQQSAALQQFAEQPAGAKDENLLNSIVPEKERSSMKVHDEPTDGAAAMEGTRKLLEEKDAAIDQTKVQVQQKREDFKAKACAVPAEMTQDAPILMQLADAKKAMATKNDDVLKAHNCETTKKVLETFKPNEAVPTEKTALRTRAREVKDELQMQRVQEALAQGKRVLEAVEQNPVYALLGEAVALGSDDGIFSKEKEVAETKKNEGKRMSADYQANKKALEAQIKKLEKDIEKSTATYNKDEADLIKLLQQLGDAWAKFVASKHKVDWQTEQNARYSAQQKKMTESFEKMTADKTEVDRLSESIQEKASTYKKEAIAQREETASAVAAHHASSVKTLSESVGVAASLLKKAEAFFGAQKREEEARLAKKEEERAQALQAGNSDDAQDLGTDIQTCKEKIEEHKQILLDITAVSNRKALAIERLEASTSSNEEVRNRDVLEAYKSGMESVGAYFQLESRMSAASASSQDTQSAAASQETALGVRAQQDMQAQFDEFKRQMLHQMMKLKDENDRLKANKRAMVAINARRVRPRLVRADPEGEEEEEEEGAEEEQE